MKIKLSVIVMTVVLILQITGCSLRKDEKVEQSNKEVFLIAKGWEGGDNIITLNSDNPLLAETYYYYKLDPGSYKVKCELTNSEIPFSMLLFQGTNTIKEKDSNGIEYEKFPEVSSYDFEEGDTLEYTFTIEESVYFRGSNNAVYYFYKTD